MENIKNRKRTSGLNALALSSMLLVSAASVANENPTSETDKKVDEKVEKTEKVVNNDKSEQVEKELEADAEKSKKRIDKRRGHGRYKKVTLSSDMTYYTIDGKEELGPNPVEGEDFYVEYDREKYGDEDYDYDDEYEERHSHRKRFRHRMRDFNDRDGFYLAYSAVSSSGDDFYQSSENNDAEFDSHFSYRVQFLGLFAESPGLNSRRLHGLYASNAWGINFYNDDNWSFDIYKQFNTEKVEGLAQIQSRNLSRRAGIRATGYFDSGQLQFIYSPYSRGKQEEDGIEASISYTHYWQIKNWNIYGSLGAQYQSEEVVDFYQPEQVADQSRVNTSAELGFEYALSEHWVLGAFASYNELESQRSDIEDATNGTRAGLLLTFVF